VHGWHAARRGGCGVEELHFDEEVSVDGGGVEPCAGAVTMTGDDDVAPLVAGECFW
jgi:hypothetical protein